MIRARRLLVFGLAALLFITIVWVFASDVGAGEGYTGQASLDGNADTGPVRLSQYLPGMFFLGIVILAMLYLDRKEN